MLKKKKHEKSESVCVCVAVPLGGSRDERDLHFHICHPHPPPPRPLDASHGQDPPPPSPPETRLFGGRMKGTLGINHKLEHRGRKGGRCTLDSRKGKGGGDIDDDEHHLICWSIKTNLFGRVGRGQQCRLDVPVDWNRQGRCWPTHLTIKGDKKGHRVCVCVFFLKTPRGTPISASAKHRSIRSIDSSLGICSNGWGLTGPYCWFGGGGGDIRLWFRRDRSLRSSRTQRKALPARLFLSRLASRKRVSFCLLITRERVI